MQLVPPDSTPASGCDRASRARVPSPLTQHNAVTRFLALKPKPLLAGSFHLVTLPTSALSMTPWALPPHSGYTAIPMLADKSPSRYFRNSSYDVCSDNPVLWYIRLLSESTSSMFLKACSNISTHSSMEPTSPYGLRSVILEDTPLHRRARFQLHPTP